VLLTIAVIFIGGFFSWRFTEIALYPHIIINGGTFVWEGHHYAPTDDNSLDDAPKRSGLKKVAFEKIKGASYSDNLFLDIFSPYNLYEVKNDSKHNVLWVIGLMDFEKYVRVD
jgi:hypothetical protein